MSIIDSRRDRQMASARLDAVKLSIAGLQTHIDMIFKAQPNLYINVQKALAEIDYHLASARIELDEAQKRINKL